MGDASIKGRSPLLKGGRVGFSRAGPVGNLPWVRGTSRPGVKKAPRGAEHKEAIKQEKTYVKADREIIPGKQTPVNYTKSRWKSWKKTKSQQYKRKEAFKEKTSAALEAKHPGFKKIAAKNFPSFLKSAATKAKGGKV